MCRFHDAVADTVRHARCTVDNRPATMADTATSILIGLTLIAGLSVLIASALTGAPSLPSTGLMAQDVIALLNEEAVPAGATIYEFGSGWGSLAIALARAFPQAQIIGIEISPVPYLASRIRALRYPNLRFEWGDFRKRDTSDAHAITCYLMPALMPRVAQHLDANAQPGTRVICIEFWFRGRHVVAARRENRRGAVALYRWPAKRPPDRSGSL